MIIFYYEFNLDRHVWILIVLYSSAQIIKGQLESSYKQKLNRIYPVPWLLQHRLNLDTVFMDVPLLASGTLHSSFTTLR